MKNNLSVIIKITVLLIFIPVVLMIPYFTSRDYIGGEQYTVSFAKFVNQSYEKKVIPTWDPYRQSGRPFLADPPYYSFFYPVHYMLYLMDITVKNQIFCDILLHFILLGIISFFGFLSLGFSIQASFFAAITILGSSIFHNTLNKGYHFFIISFPLIYLCYFLIENWMKRRRLRYLVLFSIVLGLNFLGGNIQYIVYFLVLISLRILYEDYIKFKEHRKIKKLNFQKFIIAAAAGICIGCFRFFPMLYYSKYSTRGLQGIWWNGNGSINPMFIFNLILIPGLATGSVIPFLLLISSSFKKVWSDRICRFWIVSLAIICLFAVGIYTPFFIVIARLPGFKYFRRPGRVLFLLPLAYGYISAYIISNYKRVMDISPKIIRKKIFFYSIAALLIYCYGLFLKIFFSKIEFIYNNLINPLVTIEFIKNNASKISDRMGLTVNDLIQSAGYPKFLVITLLVIIFFILIKKKRYSLNSLLILAAVELFAVFYSHNPAYVFLKPKDFTTSKDNLKYFREKDKRVIIYKEPDKYKNPFMPLSALVYQNIYSTSGISSYFSKRYAVFVLEAINEKKLGDVFKTAELVYIEDYNSKLLKFFNPGYLFSPVKIVSDKWSLINPGSMTGYIYKSTFSSEPCYFYFKEKNMENPRRIAELLRNAEVEEINSTIFTERKKTLVTGKGNNNGRILSYERVVPNRIKIEIETENNAILLVTESYDPNWKAYIDGKETKIFPGNITFISLEIPAGRHFINMVHSINYLTLFFNRP